MVPITLEGDTVLVPVTLDHGQQILLVVYPQIYSTDLNDLICKIDLNPTMALLGAISTAELMRMKENEPFPCTSTRLRYSPLT
jgi:hypothetical protein